MKRRIFLKRAGWMATLGLYPSCLSRSSSQSHSKQGKENRLGIALVGLGYYSTNLLAPALQKTQNCYLAGIVTGSPEKIPIWQSRYGVADSNVYSYDTMQEIANNDEIDVVYIVTPTGTHRDFAIRAAESGKHVWCEKPMAMTAKECQDIIDACKRNGVRLSIGYRMLHETNTMELISYAQSKPFGEIESIYASACYSGGAPSGWRAQKAMGGGALYDMGVYTVNGICYASGLKPLEVISARHIIDRPEAFKEVDETTEYQLLLENGIIAKGYTSVGKPGNELRVDCENGWYNLQPMQSYNGVVGQRSDGIALDSFVDCQQCLQMDNDALAIMNGQAFRATGEMGKRDVAIIEGILTAAETESSVKLAL